MLLKDKRLLLVRTGEGMGLPSDLCHVGFGVCEGDNGAVALSVHVALLEFYGMGPRDGNALPKLDTESFKKKNTNISVAEARRDTVLNVPSPRDHARHKEKAFESRSPSGTKGLSVSTCGAFGSLA